MNRRRLVAALAVLGLAPRMAKADSGWIVDEIYGAAARWGGDLAYARIDVWDGEQRILIRKRS